MWHTKEITFDNKAQAFDYLNNVKSDIDLIRVYFDNELRYSKSNLGLFDEYNQSYVKGLLPIETYN